MRYCLRQSFPFWALLILISVTNGSAQSVDISLLAVNRLPEARSNTPLTWSIPLGVSENLRNTSGLRLLNSGVEIPAQYTVLARSGGSPADSSRAIAWLLIDTQLTLAANETAELRLITGTPEAAASPLQITRDNASGMTIDTGAAVYEISRQHFHFFERVALNGGSEFAGNGGISLNGGIVDQPVTLSVEHSGTERISLLAQGSLSGELRHTTRLHFYRNLAEVRVDFRVENNSTPDQIMGQPQSNDYGSSGSISFDDLSIILPSAAENSYVIPNGELGAEGESSADFSSQISLIQESSGDEYWNLLQTESPRQQGGVRKRSSTRIIDGSESDGPNRIAGWLDAKQITVSVEYAWQNYPKAFRANLSSVQLGLFPGEFSQDHQLRAGEYKTHTFWIRHHAPETPDVAARARSSLERVHLLRDVTESLQSGSLLYFAPRDEERFYFYEKGNELQLVAPTEQDNAECLAHGGPECRVETGQNESTSVFDAVARTAHYGWVDFGDIPTDFETPVTSPFNLKYSAVTGMCLQGLSNGDSSLGALWWYLAASGARHTADIDIHHSTKRGYAAERFWFEGGMYGHLYHDDGPDPGQHPHRNPGNPTPEMSGPIEGIFIYGLLSGDTLLLDSALEAADNLFWRTVNSSYYLPEGDGVIDFRATAQDVGLQRCGDECYGWAPVFGGREAANVIQAQLMAYLVTGDNSYLQLISQIAAFVERYRREISQYYEQVRSCNRFHMEALFLKKLGEYILFRQTLGLAGDIAANGLFERSINYMTSTLWDPSLGSQPFRLCYVNDQDGELESDPLSDEEFSRSQSYIDNNWLFGIADVFALGSITLNRPELLSNYAAVVFDFGARNQFYPGSTVSYHFAKEFVNQVGLGNDYLYADYLSRAEPPIERTASDVYALWNGFLGMLNVLEIVNHSGQGATVTVKLYRSDGSGASQRSIYIDSYSQYDQVLNELPGFDSQSYGIVTLDHDSANINGRVSYYRQATGSGDFDFAYSIPFGSTLGGTTYTPFNTFQPSHNPAHFGNRVLNWLSVVNLDTAEYRSFTVNRYLQDGTLVRSDTISVPPFGRADIDGGHGEGADRVGLNQIIAESSSAYLALLMRYGERGADFDFATPFIASAGSAETKWVPISSGASGLNWVEVGNTGESEAQVAVNVFDNFGRELIPGGEHFTVPAKGQHHIFASSLLEPGFSGAAQIRSENNITLSSASLYYFFDSSGQTSAVYAARDSLPSTTSLNGSYNLFLGMFNWLRVFNTEASAQQARLLVYSPSGVHEQTLDLAPHSGADLGLHQFANYGTSPDTYGLVQIEGGGLMADLIRVRETSRFAAELDFIFPTALTDMN